MVVVLGVYFVHMGAQRSSEGMSIVGYVAFGAAFVLLCIVVFLRKKIELTAAMITETCRGVQSNLILFPVALLVIAAFLAFSTYWVASFVYLYSIPGDTVEVNSPNVNLPQMPKFNESIRNLMWFMLFGFLWVSAFISSVFQHTVAGAISSWYFSRDVRTVRPARAPALSSLFRSITTSFGSLAFGSLLIAIVETMHVMLYWVKKANYKNRFAVFVVKCLQCLLSCVECALKFVNKYAVIYVAMHGYSFCKAARECMELISRNFFNTVVTEMIGGFVLFMGKIAFTALATFVTVAAVDGLHRPLSGITLGMTALISFVVLHIISLIIGAGIDTVFVCYLEDLEENPDGNLYISPDLHRKLQEKSSESKAYPDAI